MFKKSISYFTAEQILNHENETIIEGEHGESFALNQFTNQDLDHLKVISQVLQPFFDEAVVLFSGLLHKSNMDGKMISENDIYQYLSHFLTQDRTQDYLKVTIPFFRLLREHHDHVGKLIVAFNQLHFFFSTILLSRKRMQPKLYMELSATLQRAFNIDQQLLIEIHNEKVIETVADGISELMNKNAEIMYIKDLLEKLERQHDQSQNVSASSEQMASSIDEVARNALVVAQKADEAVQRTESGKQVITEALEEIIRSEEHFELIAENFKEWQQYLSSIGNITEIINDIASQTQLLALNASIEAAKAGEEGRGFSVVAGEIRKLANSTTESLKEVQQNISKVSQLSNEVSQIIFTASESIRKGAREAEMAIPALTEMIEQSVEINDATNQIAAITEEQAAAIVEVSQRTVEMAELTDEVQELANHTGHKVYELSKMMEMFRLSMFTKNMKLSTRTLLQLAKTDHILWKWRIYNMIMGYEKVNPTDVGSHDVCRLGQWYFNEKTVERFQHIQEYQDLDKPHQQVHQCALAATEAYLQGDIKKAEESLKEIEVASSKVIANIDAMISQL